ncbi:hypothetical protein EUX98_g5434 [Antrodiella citrinella]|uniref:Matrin-type domain-containing protein n=1 Tax=Antrodiella citrinella TaxID=2447956 RepID=A0A4S4MTT0_9APHY|nr:hypothetical protein EUX98_g5434 [Antrodiella citrinella]
MSEYWVSKKKYFCKYCNVYIADDAPSRSHHENGLRHKGNVERFVRGLYKTGEKRKQDLEEEKRDMVRVEQAAQAAFARDVDAGLVKPGSSSTLPPPKKEEAAKPTRSSNVYDNYSTAASLGYTDPDAARIEAEAERRRTEGVIASDWEFVATDGDSGTTGAVASSSAAQVEPEVGQKRALETFLFADEEDTRTFKLRRKKIGGLGDIYDPGVIPIKLKTKKEDASVDNASTSASTPASLGPIKWSARGWNKPGAEPDKERESGEAVAPNSAIDSHTSIPLVQEPPVESLEHAVLSDIAKTLEVVKTEEGSTPAVKSEEAEPSTAAAPSGMFRKRKIRGGAAGVRGRTE